MRVLFSHCTVEDVCHLFSKYFGSAFSNSPGNSLFPSASLLKRRFIERSTAVSVIGCSRERGSPIYVEIPLSTSLVDIHMHTNKI